MKKAVFLDRDGVINRVCYHNEKGIYSPMSLEEFDILPGVKESLKKLKKSGYFLAAVSNQPGVAFGYIDKKKLEEIDSFMKNELVIDEVYNCPHHPDFTGNCECRKPKDGLLMRAAGENGLDVSESFMIGDNLSDVKAGKKCRATFLIVRKKTVALLNLIEEKKAKPDYMVKSLKDAAGIILSNF